MSGQCIVNEYSFDNSLLEKISMSSNLFERDFWPLVYIIRHEGQREAYVGETTKARGRMEDHLKNPKKQHLEKVQFITSEQFNKSATLDIEANLIKYLSADGKYHLLNGNLGLANHNYFQKNEIYWPIFRSLWQSLKSSKLVEKSLDKIDNSDLFKYSPYKSLTDDQLVCLKEMLLAILNPDLGQVLVNGGAGTGKSVLAIFLFKLLHTDFDPDYVEMLKQEDRHILELAKKVKLLYPDLKMTLVIPMSSFRKTVKRIFSQVKGLKSSMVTGPAELGKQKYNIVIVDEAHRLRRRVNLGAAYGSFDRVCAKLGMDKDQATELSWVQARSDKSILFYDAKQSIKPTDVLRSDFERILASRDSIKLELRSQLRVKGGALVVDFIRDLIYGHNLQELKPFESKEYELYLFDDLARMRDEILLREQAVGLSRMVAGFAWKWVSKKDPKRFDIKIGDVQLKWNSTALDWVNTANAVYEVGCIHTVQGYDLNYVGVIFGHEIDYNPQTELIEVDKRKYYDVNGKNTIEDPQQLHDYILNIYNTILLRGIKGAFIYACNKNLKDYLAQYVPRFEAMSNKPTLFTSGAVNTVPVFDIDEVPMTAEGGIHAELFLQIPDRLIKKEPQFACKINMTPIYGIPTNKEDYCLFSWREPGSFVQPGKIVLTGPDLSASKAVNAYDKYYPHLSDAKRAGALARSLQEEPSDVHEYKEGDLRFVIGVYEGVALD